MIPNPTPAAASARELLHRRSAALATPTDLNHGAPRAIGSTLNALLADVFALYLKTKNFHWHLSGPHFRDLHRMLDTQGEELIAMTDPMAERCRVLGVNTLHSIGQISRLQRLLDNDADYVEPQAMLAELRDDNRQMAEHLRSAHELCSEHRDIATADALGRWLDETERRTWFLFEASRSDEATSRTTVAVLTV
jgi:starvation-inducible DNA-binding protein